MLLKLLSFVLSIIFFSPALYVIILSNCGRVFVTRCESDVLIEVGEAVLVDLTELYLFVVVGLILIAVLVKFMTVDDVILGLVDLILFVVVVKVEFSVLSELAIIIVPF